MVIIDQPQKNHRDTVVPRSYAIFKGPKKLKLSYFPPCYAIFPPRYDTHIFLSRHSGSESVTPTFCRKIPQTPVTKQTLDYKKSEEKLKIFPRNFYLLLRMNLLIIELKLKFQSPLKCRAGSETNRETFRINFS